MNGPISRYLPVRFSNGNSISRFAKHCPRCRNLVPATQMNGRLGLMQDKLFIAARAQCDCGQRFNVACVIDEHKQVHRVLLPMWLFRFWLRQSKLPQPLRRDDAKLRLDDAPLPEAPRGLQLPADVTLTPSADVVGRFQGADIPATLASSDGRRFAFERALPAGGAARLGEDELVYQDRLVYRAA